MVPCPKGTRSCRLVASVNFAIVSVLWPLRLLPQCCVRMIRAKSLLMLCGMRSTCLLRMVTLMLITMDCYASSHLCILAEITASLLLTKYDQTMKRTLLYLPMLALLLGCASGT